MQTARLILQVVVFGEEGAFLCLKMVYAKLSKAADRTGNLKLNSSFSDYCREVKRADTSMSNLVQLLDSSPQNTATNEKSKMQMISYRTNGYLKQLVEMDIPRAKKHLRG
ncbi:hypothetical protein FEM48_Zijuj08G0189600 [Ziziphus jujuba var. spinosa]|uniref:Uncharacterized protein n=1 Tax=Ziziphus jujuba var. spinosa TaxID=714518 RepID=A0A978V0T4_ZIZJJ|nr:hypothetical protein FEM48_Zijuj08G0189600 [Ziziphus jujuba var. spinosa]